MDLPVYKVRKIMKIAQEPISLETPIGEEEDSPSRRLHRGQAGGLADRRGDLDLAARADARRHEDADAARGGGAAKRFGLGDGTEHTLEEVGQAPHVTRERIRQIESKALRKLRHPSRAGEVEAVPGYRL